MISLEIHNGTLTNAACKLLTLCFLRLFKPDNPRYNALSEDSAFVWNLNTGDDTITGTCVIDNAATVSIVAQRDNRNSLTTMEYEITSEGITVEKANSLRLSPLQETEIKMHFAPEPTFADRDSTHLIDSALSHTLFEGVPDGIETPLTTEALEQFMSDTDQLAETYAENYGGLVHPPARFETRHQATSFLYSLAKTLETTLLEQMGDKGLTHIAFPDQKYDKAFISGNILMMGTKDNDEAWFQTLPHDEQVRTFEKMSRIIFDA